MSASNEIATIGTNGGGQVQRPDHSNTLGNAPKVYQTERTKKARAGHATDVAVQVALGNYPIERLTPEATASVPGAGGRWACHAVLNYLAANWNAETQYAYASNQTIATALGMSRATVNKSIAVLVNVKIIYVVGIAYKGVIKYAFNVEGCRIVESDNSVLIIQKVPQPVLNSTHIQIQEQSQEQVQEQSQIDASKQSIWETIGPNKYNNNESVSEINWPIILNYLPENLKPDKNAWATCEAVLINWQWSGDDKTATAHRLGKAIGDRVTASRPPIQTPGGVVALMKQMATEPAPKKPTEIVLCGVDNCDGHRHENPNTQRPYACPNKPKPF